jgi:N4-gp56 family major capsid protein
MQFLIFILLGLFAFVGTTPFAATTLSTTIPEAIRAVYSQEILFHSQPRLRFHQFAQIKTELGIRRGKSISFIKFGNLTSGGAIAENAVIVPEALSTSEIEIVVTEHAGATSISEKALKLSYISPLQNASQLLAHNYAKVLDAQFRDLLLTAPNTVFGGGKATAATLVTGDGLDTETIKNAVEQLERNNAPRFNGEYYVCIASPHQIRQLRDDPSWVDAHKYNSNSRLLYLGEVGMYEGVIFLQTSQMPELTTAQVVAKYGAGFTPTTGYEAVIFGENAYGWAIALPVELRDDGTKDFGRQHDLAWYGIWGMNLIEEDNIFKILSA